MSTGAATVYIVDDDASWRKSAHRLLAAAGYRVLLYDSAEALLESAELESPGCILLDLRMPRLSGLQLQQRLAAMRLKRPIVFASGHGDVPSTVLAMKSGAEDFLTKPVATRVLLDAIARAVARDRDDRSKREQLDLWRSRYESLTATERRVLDLVVTGMLNKRIAAELGTAERTIKWHRHNFMQKLQIDSLAELVSIAERLGLIGGRDPS